jgi:hypothetical protein
MTTNQRGSRPGSWKAVVCIATTLGFALGAGACDKLLEVELPAQLGDEALDNPAGADSQIATIIEHFEQGYDLTTWQFHGHEDGGEIRLASPGTNAGDMTYSYNAVGGPLSTAQIGGGGYEGWFQEFATSRRFATYLHNKLDKEWTVAQVANRQRYLAISSIYEGAVLNMMGSAICEIALDGGKLLTPAEVLTMAEAALTRALTEIGTTDFAMPYGISTSARTMAYGLRAQVRWMKGDRTGALADAQQVPTGFRAFVTRDAAPARRNKAFWAGTLSRYAELYDVNNWWTPGAGGRINPVTRQPWPQNIPFTGYPYLGILPDGRAVRDDGLPIRRTGANAAVPGVEATAVADVRVPFYLGQISGLGSGQRPIHQKYPALDSDIPMVNWKEMVLIRAEIQGGQAAIDLVNTLRTADNLPRVTYASAANATQIKYMIIEERRRALFLEGRFFFTKLQNTDVLWFPRAQGQTPGAGRALEGGVRFIMPNNEFLLNPNAKLEDRGTKCDVNQRPVITV